ncbi:MAG: GMC family oxidoreductase [Deltaproteobacteria bacterium]|nr:GMC family oxidoreductase [Deltaproteobacteria bacterium]
MIRSGNELTEDLVVEAPACVVGLGAGGSVVLRALARAGLPAVALEEGSDHTPFQFNQREEQMIPELFQERGGRMTDDLAIQVLQGRGVGGSTIHNTNLCKRTPTEILELWARRYGVEGCGPRDMEAAFQTIERDLSVSRIPDDGINPNNDALRRGIAALGWRGGVLSHNRVGCIGSGFCELGCAYDAKRNARKVLIPEALDRGARIFSDVRATRILHDRKQVLGVEGRTAGGRRVTVRTKVVVLAGSAVGSAALAIASELPDPHLQQGEHLRIHPGGVVAGVFDQPIDGWKGIPQSYECTEWLDLDEKSDKRVWITTAFAHPIGTAVVLPGFGAAHMKSMRGYRHLAVLTAMLHDESAGHVWLKDGTRTMLHYEMNEGDRRQMVIGLRACARILLAAGAREVVVPAVPPLTIRREAEIERIDANVVRPHNIPLTAVHPMGTMRMGREPKTSVVRSTGEHHHVRGVFVADGSLFPTSLGGPPQISIYAFAEHLSPHIVAAARG